MLEILVANKEILVPPCVNFGLFSKIIPRFIIFPTSLYGHCWLSAFSAKGNELDTTFLFDIFRLLRHDQSRTNKIQVPSSNQTSY
ncbi:hypothetical protein ERO13_A05G322408v2 [Gossypium hirsutum]|uniref:Uncharacterized protein n=1 Tax=Gossypium barbadense TaxID=3634 RepID=A0A5J5VWD1_GOSBA|nr:hypothetical protein ES319_A05G338900v1 [Gossypium barbadense]KAG4202190.1 hypothetical protein ERO13_A05G322408v2 [Gossypium hirsutum]